MRTLEQLATVWVFLALVASNTSAEEKFFDSDGVRIRYLDQGTGEAVVLLHGNGSWAELVWGETGVIGSLSKQYRVLALDCRGYGKSDKPHDPSEYGSKMAGDVVRLLDHLNIGRAHVVGYSMGARITSWLIVNQPGRLISATLAGSTYFVDTPEQRQWFENSARQAAAGMDPVRVQQNTGMTAEQAADFVARRAAMNDPLARQAVALGYPSLCITESALSETDVPVLLVVGSLDANLPAFRHVKEDVLPSAEFVVVDGATHSGPQGVFRRKEFLETIQGFIRTHGSSQSSGETRGDIR